MDNPSGDEEEPQLITISLIRCLYLEHMKDTEGVKPSRYISCTFTTHFIRKYSNSHLESPFYLAKSDIFCTVSLHLSYRSQEVQ